MNIRTLPQAPALFAGGVMCGSSLLAAANYRPDPYPAPSVNLSAIAIACAVLATTWLSGRIWVAQAIAVGGLAVVITSATDNDHLAALGAAMIVAGLATLATNVIAQAAFASGAVCGAALGSLTWDWVEYGIFRPSDAAPTAVAAVAAIGIIAARWETAESDPDFVSIGICAAIPATFAALDYFTDDPVGRMFTFTVILCSAAWFLRGRGGLMLLAGAVGVTVAGRMLSAAPWYISTLVAGAVLGAFVGIRMPQPILPLAAVACIALPSVGFSPEVVVVLALCATSWALAAASRAQSHVLACAIAIPAILAYFLFEDGGTPVALIWIVGDAPPRTEVADPTWPRAICVVVCVMVAALIGWRAAYDRKAAPDERTHL